MRWRQAPNGTTGNDTAGRVNAAPCRHQRQTASALFDLVPG
jgi:hypothetical protein